MPQIPLLDNFLQGEVPHGTNIAVAGPPGVGKTSLCQTILKGYLAQKGVVLYIALDESPTRIRQKLNQNEMSDISGRIVFLDGYSWLVGPSEEKYSLPSLDNLKTLVDAVSKVSHDVGPGAMAVWDSVSTLLLYNGQIELARFLKTQMARMKHRGMLTFYILNQSPSVELFVHNAYHMADGIIEMKMEESTEIRRFMRIRSFKGLEHAAAWVPFSIDSSGKLTPYVTDRRML